MRHNWKVLVALVVIAGTFLWVVDSVRFRLYSGTQLNFAIGHGPVTVTNSSSESVPVRLVATGTRSFTVSSNVEDVSGTSTQQGTGRDSTQLFEWASPPGISEFTVARGTDVNFVTNTPSQLEATVQLLSAGEVSTTMITAVVIILAALFYIVRTTRYNWITDSTTRRFRPIS